MRGYQYVLDSGIFYVATEKDSVVGVCCGILRDGIWFLSGYWMLPECQGRGGGKHLTRSVWREAAEKGAQTYCVWSSLDMRAMAAYLKLGMYPGYEILTYKVPRVSAAELPDHYSIRELDLQTASEIDATIRGTARRTDHEFLLATPGQCSFQVEFKGQPVGYFYVRNEWIGPLAWSAPKYAQIVLEQATQRVEAEELLITIPGCNHAALEYAISQKGKLVSNSHFFTTASFGKLDQYLPSGPLLY